MKEIVNIKNCTIELIASEERPVQAFIPFRKFSIFFKMNNDIVHDIEPLLQVDVAVLVGITYFAQVPEVFLEVLLESLTQNLKARVSLGICFRDDSLSMIIYIDV